MVLTPPVRTGRPVLRTVALVGIDGSGKTTQAHRLAHDLAAAGLRASYRRNAGGRHWFGRLAVALGRRDAEDLLGRRTMLIVESVLRWLAILRTIVRQWWTGLQSGQGWRRGGRTGGEIAVMDRYAVCQYASLRAHGARPAAERRARLAYRLFPRPDVTLLLAVDPQVAHRRIEARGYDHEDIGFLYAAAAAYRSLPEYPGFVVIDANGTPDEVAAAVRAGLGLPAVPPERPGMASLPAVPPERPGTASLPAVPPGPPARPQA